MSESTIDKELLTNLKLAKKRDPSKPLFFALIVKSPSEGALIVGKKKIPTKQIAEAKKEVGAMMIVKGLCYGEGGDLVFETVKPPAPNWTVLTKRLAKQNAGLTVVPVYRQGRDDEAVAESVADDVEDAGDKPDAGDGPAAKKEAADAAWKRRVEAATAAVKAAAAAGYPAVRDLALGISEAGTLYRSGQPDAAERRLAGVEALAGPAAKPPAPPPTPTPAADATKRFNAITPALKAALQAKGPNLTRIQTLAGAVAGLLKNGDPVQAGRVMDELEPLLKPAGDAGADPAAAWKAKLAEATPAIKAALAAKGPTAAEIGKLFARASAQSKPGGDAAEALKLLAECQALAVAATATAPKMDADPAGEYRAKLAEFTPAIKAALAAKGPAAAEIGRLLAQATASSKPGGDPARALELLTEAHAKAKAADAPPTATPTAGPSFVVLQQCRLAWETARKKVEGEIAAFQALVRSKGKDDEAAAVAAKIADTYDGVRAAFDSTLTDTLDEALNAAEPAARAAINRRAGAMIADYRDFVAGDEHLAELRDNPFLKMPSLAALDATLKVLSSKLSA